MTAETRDRILQVAARLFHEQGYAATGVATILREAEVNSGSLYHFFPSKDDLLRGVLDWYIDHLQPTIMAPIEEAEPDPLLRIPRLMRWYRDFLAENGCRLGCPVGNLALEVSDTRPELRAWLARNFDNWTDCIHGWLEAAGPRLPEHCDRHALAVYILTVMEGAVMQARATGTLQPFDDSVAWLEDHLLRLQQAARPPAGSGDGASSATAEAAA